MIALENYPGYYAEKDGHIYSTRNGILRQLPERIHKGYYRVNVRDGSTPAKKYAIPVHKLILEAFVGARPPGYVCRHLNGNAFDNRLENLCWGTPKENAQDAATHGTAVWLRHGEKAVAAKLTEQDIYRIIEMYEQGHKQKDIACVFSVTQRHVSDIVNKKTWCHLWAPPGEGEISGSFISCNGRGVSRTKKAKSKG